MGNFPLIFCLYQIAYRTTLKLGRTLLSTPPDRRSEIIIHPPRSSVPVDRHHRRPPPPLTATPADCHPRRLSMLLSATTVDCRRRHTSSPLGAVVYIAALPSASTFIIVACHQDGIKRATTKGAMARAKTPAWDLCRSSSEQSVASPPQTTGASPTSSSLCVQSRPTSCCCGG